MTLSVAVSGASGYAGGEILRLLADHPDVEVRTVTAHSSAGQPLLAHQPHLRSLAHLELQPTTPEILSGHDVVFLALPHGQSAQYTDALSGTPLVIDAGADHRLTSSEDWAAFYGGPHPEPWAYGVPELPIGGGKLRDRLRRATRIAAPGCNASTVSLSLAPGVAAGVIDPGDIVSVLAVGPSGAGKAAKTNLLASEILGTANPYAVGGTHRHIPRSVRRSSLPAPRPMASACPSPGARAHGTRDPGHLLRADSGGGDGCRDPGGVAERVRRRTLRRAAAGRDVPTDGRRAGRQRRLARPRDRPRGEPGRGRRRRRQSGEGHRGRRGAVHEHRAGAPRDHRASSERSRPVSVTIPAGFEAAGVAVGLKSTGARDVAVVVNRGPQKVGAAVFTSNRAKANPILWSEQVVKDGVVEAVVLNSGGANCFTGAFGFQTTHQTAERAAELLGVGAGDVVVCSTGLIGTGDEVFRAKVLDGVEKGIAALSADGGDDASLAIMTTDSRSKRAVHHGEGWSIGGMAKGAGMLAPGLATMLVVLTTDVVLDAAEADAALRAATRVSFDRLDSDGCMSTNDQVTLLSSGASGIRVDADEFAAALTSVCDDLAAQLQGDAEGASHDITIRVVHAASEDDAVEIGRSIARNNLFKAAIFGNDPNWGRVLAAIGTTQAAFDPYDVDVWMNGVRVCSAGGPDRPREDVDLTPRATDLLVDLRVGDAEATIRTNDLTHDYVHENSAYSS
ncbi:hypothetical protein LUZ63_021066 [Rhynchospora breviuscula]|uniref:Arginine biosynthesis bifunctional protein ArgJ, chloroplastic n=1 Tax=Rhynchospora breviuscula TaxID=2022672 RepID=A0A9P9Z7F0_9POAL|nr:hypothetical protein LUZ63_021066 [Rhynchospora breviuscula]